MIKKRMGNIEMSVLGAACLYGYEELYEEFQNLHEDCFSNETIKELYSKIKKNKFLMNVYWEKFDSIEKAFFMQAIESVIGINVACAEIDFLKKEQVKTVIRKKLENEIINPDLSPEELIAFIERERAKSSIGVLRDNSDFLQRIREPIKAMKFGYSLTDWKTGGMYIGSTAIIGAYPSMGKTSFSLNVADFRLKQQDTVIIFSLEMSRKMVLERMASIRLKIDYNKFRHNRQDESDRRMYHNTLDGSDRAAIDEYLIETKGRLIIADNVYDVETMADIVREVKPDLFIVDYIQKAISQRKHADRRDNIDNAIGVLKNTAKRNGSCGIVLSQLSRSGKESPTMQNLKESGALEAEGDLVMLLHRPYVLDKRLEDEKEKAFLRIDKNKFGECGTVEFKFKGEFQRFYEIDKKQQGESNEQIIF